MIFCVYGGRELVWVQDASPVPRSVTCLTLPPVKLVPLLLVWFHLPTLAYYLFCGPGVGDLGSFGSKGYPPM
jgi:hypothetical protein